MQKRVALSAVILLFTVAPALATLPGNGERIAQTCSGCHGTQGASPSSHIPVIGGQNAAYLTKSMKEYRDGLRPGGVMANLSKGYSDTQIEETSQVIASWKWKNTPFAIKTHKNKAVASTESCAECHGKKGDGTESAPRINGQSPDYLKETLLEYKNGTRKAPEMELLKDMTDASLNELVKFYTRK